MSEYAKEFGKHIRSLRRARGITQDVLAHRSGLSPDTIRRIEHGSFSASIDTLRKLCFGLNVAPSTLFESFELGHADERRELIDLLAGRTSADLAVATRVLRVLLDELDGLRPGAPEPPGPSLGVRQRVHLDHRRKRDPGEDQLRDPISDADVLAPIAEVPQLDPDLTTVVRVDRSDVSNEILLERESTAPANLALHGHSTGDVG